MPRHLLCSIALFLFTPLLGNAQPDTVKVKDNFFEPETLYVTEGDTVVWENVGSNTHTSTSGDNCTGNGNWDSGSLSSGQTFQRQFNSQGLYDYFCVPHCGSGMTGVIYVYDATSLEEKEAEVPELELRPVPFKDELKVGLKGDRSHVQRLTVIDMTGRTVKSLDGSEVQGKGPLQLDASDWESGVYFVKLSHENGNRTRKVIKQ